MKRVLLIFFSIQCFSLFSQQIDNNVLTLEEFLGYVKKFHPLVKQANLKLDESQAKLLKARGAFDPKVEVDYDKKNFKNTNYYNKLNAAFKIPTWYGIEIKGKFEENSGAYLNPELNVPANGLYNVGVTVALAKNLLINERMATLKRAKLKVKQVEADNQLQVNEVLHKAIIAYFNWVKHYKNQQVYQSFLLNAHTRFDGIKRSFESGDKPAIDTLEAKIVIRNRKLSLEKASLDFIKSSLELSNYLWLDNNIPIEIQESVLPDVKTSETADHILELNNLYLERFSIAMHPKLLSLQNQYKNLEIDKRLKLNNLLPRVDFQYNFLTQEPLILNAYTDSNYKVGLGISMPLFLRKERGDLTLAKIKLKETEYKLTTTEIGLKNKRDQLLNASKSYTKQFDIVNNLVKDYTLLLTAEERKFDLGESSIFLINSRESKLIDVKLKAIDIEYGTLSLKADLFKFYALN